MKNYIQPGDKKIEISEDTAKNLKSEFGKEEKKLEIKSRFGGVIYTSSKTIMKEAVEEAIESEANLSGANLSGANLREADLSEANLREADLYEANLRGANLREADLSEANLRGANLCEANFENVELSCAKFYGKGGTTKIKQNQIEPFLKALGIVVE